jgi:deoxyadenosine/deoxycytidine kinase
MYKRVIQFSIPPFNLQVFIACAVAHFGSSASKTSAKNAPWRWVEPALVALRTKIGHTECAFAFQMMAYISRLSGLRKIIRENPDIKIIITERSLYTDKYIFEKMLYDQGKIKEYEHQIYLMWFDEFAKDFDINDVIYIKTDPSKCYERVHIRAREGEELIPLSYLEECHKYHEEFLDPMSGLFKQQLVLDGNQDIFQNEGVVHERLEQIDAFIL